jgi:hypothetical protein
MAQGMSRSFFFECPRQFVLHAHPMPQQSQHRRLIGRQSADGFGKLFRALL